MKTTGIVRKIDELGRIVIPKEIRKRLKIDSGDEVDIAVEEECVILSKYFPIHQDSIIVKALCDTLKEVYNCDIIVTDTHKVIYNTIDIAYNDEELDEEFLKRINSYIDKEISARNSLCLTKSYCFDKDAIINEIIIHNELFGYLIIVDSLISKKNKDLAVLILNYLNKVL